MKTTPGLSKDRLNANAISCVPPVLPDQPEKSPIQTVKSADHIAATLIKKITPWTGGVAHSGPVFAPVATVIVSPKTTLFLTLMFNEEHYEEVLP